MPADLKSIEAQLRDGIGRFLSANPGTARLDPISTIPDARLVALGRYIELLQRWGERFNLVADRGTTEIIDTHLLDCAALWAYLREEGVLAGPVLDIGSGAGLPGMVLAILEPDTAVVLSEPRQKRFQFLLEVKRQLGLERVAPQQHRAEQGIEGGPFNLVTARAVSKPEDLLSLAKPLLSPHGRAALMVGPKIEAEFEFEGRKLKRFQYLLSDKRPRVILFG